MERFCHMSLDELELVVATGGIEIEDATYPPCCVPRRGPLRIVPCERGAVKIAVAPCHIQDLESFELSVLFGSGTCIFADAEYVLGFFRGPIARAFGIECEPLPPRAAPDPPAAPALEPEGAVGEREDERPPERRRSTPLAVPRPDALAQELARTVRGQDVALGQVARAVATHLAKRSPSRPESLLLVGPTGTGKTSAVEALPGALEELGVPGVHVFRVDCGELVSWSDLRRILGAPPSYIGYVEEPPLVAALREPGCILLLDEVEKASSALHDVFLALLDTGRLTAPDGETVEAPRAVVVMTTNLGADDLGYRLRDLQPGRRDEQRACREHLLREGWPPELVGRIGTIAVFDELGHDALSGVAERAIHSLAGEFGLAVDDLPEVLVDVVRDLADASEIGARAYTYAARDLLSDAFADAVREGVRGSVCVDPGPPPRVIRRVRRRSRARAT